MIHTRNSSLTREAFLMTDKLIKKQNGLFFLCSEQISLVVSYKNQFPTLRNMWVGRHWLLRVMLQIQIFMNFIKFKPLIMEGPIYAVTQMSEPNTWKYIKLYTENLNTVHISPAFLRQALMQLYVLYIRHTHTHNTRIWRMAVITIIISNWTATESGSGVIVLQTQMKVLSSQKSG